MADVMVSVVGLYPEGSPLAYEVRAFCAPLGLFEDPVTGSANAAIAQWLIGRGAVTDHYVASQGTCLDRRGRIVVDRVVDGDDDQVWIGGSTHTCIRGAVEL